MGSSCSRVCPSPPSDNLVQVIKHNKRSVAPQVPSVMQPFLSKNQPAQNDNQQAVDPGRHSPALTDASVSGELPTQMPFRYFGMASKSTLKHKRMQHAWTVNPNANGAEAQKTHKFSAIMPQEEVPDETKRRLLAASDTRKSTLAEPNLECRPKASDNLGAGARELDSSLDCDAGATSVGGSMLPPLVFVEKIEDRYFFSGECLGAGSFGEVLLGWRKLFRLKEESEKSYERRCMLGPRCAIKRMKPTERHMIKALKRIAAAVDGTEKKRRMSDAFRDHVDADCSKAGERRSSVTSRPRDPAIDDDATSAERIVLKAREDMHREAEMLKLLRGGNHVVRILDHVDDGVFVYIVLEYCAGGDLMKYVRQCGHFSERMASHMFKQMLLAVAHCHDRHIVHRDLKPDQFLFADESKQAHMKLTDFGLAAVISNSGERMKDPVGSAYFMAPEVFERNYTLACDAWSMGINLYLLLSGDIPFRSRGGKNVARGVYHAIQSETLRFEGEQWAKISPDAKDLLSGLLEKRPFRRYTIEQALAHPWISGDAASDLPFDQNIINSMCNFYTQNKLRRATLRVLSSMLHADDIRKLRTAFFSMDINADQKLSFDELVTVTKSLGFDQTSKHIKSALKSIGWDRGHYINIEEFLAATTELILVRQHEHVFAAFRALDKDGNGYIDADEVRAILQGESDVKITQLMAEFDKNRDGKINYEVRSSVSRS